MQASKWPALCNRNNNIHKTMCYYVMQFIVSSQGFLMHQYGKIQLEVIKYIKAQAKYQTWSMLSTFKSKNKTFEC